MAYVRHVTEEGYGSLRYSCSVTRATAKLTLNEGTQRVNRWISYEIEVSRSRGYRDPDDNLQPVPWRVYCSARRIASHPARPPQREIVQQVCLVRTRTNIGAERTPEPDKPLLFMVQSNTGVRIRTIFQS